jgi:hypothetical protein
VAASVVINHFDAVAPGMSNENPPGHRIEGAVIEFTAVGYGDDAVCS